MFQHRKQCEASTSSCFPAHSSVILPVLTKFEMHILELSADLHEDPNIGHL